MPPYPSVLPNLARIARDPLTVFLLVGAGFFAAYTLFVDRPDQVDVSRMTTARLVADYAALSGRQPTPAEAGKIVADHVDEELLFREAIKRGLHLSDAGVRARLVERIKGDIVGSAAEPSEDDLLTFYTRHIDAYRTEPALSFDQVFFEARPKDEASVLARLNRGDAVAGDDFWMGAKMARYGESMVSSVFGLSFMERLRGLPLKTWAGPLQSDRGWHFVRVMERVPQSAQGYGDVRGQVRQDYLADIDKARLKAALASMRKNYRVTLPD